MTTNAVARAQYRLIHPRAQPPRRGRPTDAGYDIFAVETVDIQAHSAALVHTGVQLSVERGWYYTVEGRSSLWQQGLTPARGIIDATYTGELVVYLINTSNCHYTVQLGDRIAQITVHRAYDLELQEVAEFAAEFNHRGSAGFGSTGR